jgi:hypothetical protein
MKRTPRKYSRKKGRSSRKKTPKKLMASERYYGSPSRSRSRFSP